MAAEQAAERHPTSFQRPIARDGLKAILGTCRIKTACRGKKMGYVCAVEGYRYNKNKSHDARADSRLAQKNNGNSLMRLEYTIYFRENI